MTINEITAIIIEESINIHRKLGPGLFESVYERILEQRLLKRGFAVERQKEIKIVFEDLEFEEGFRSDLIVNNKVLVEIKSVEEIAPVFHKQVLTYLRLTGLQIGLLIN